MNATFASLVGERLKETRIGLGLNQADMAALVGVTREYWGRLERGASVPGGEVLTALIQNGANVLYILTGSTEGGALPLTDGDRVLLDNFHAAPAQVREGVKTTLGAFAPSADGAASDRPAAKRGKAA